jgi:hypothetical protein
MQALESIMSPFRHQHFSWLHFGHKWFMHFLDEVSFQDLEHINDFHLLRDTHVALGIMSSCVTHQPSYFTRTMLPSFSFLSFLANFNNKIMYVCGDIMGLRSWESI